MTNITDKIIVEKNDGIGHLILNQPNKRNAISLEMWQGIESVAENFSNDNEVRVVVLSGAGDKAFSAGADISQFEENRASKEATEHYNQTVMEALDALDHLNKPTIAMIQGFVWVVAQAWRPIAIFVSLLKTRDSRFPPQNLDWPIVGRTCIPWYN